MYFKDLSPYSYHGGSPRARVLNVGWLSFFRRGNRGSVGPDVVEKLVRLAGNPVAQMRGFSRCQLCLRKRVPVGVGSRILGSAEVWIPAYGTDEIFAAPDMIVHYVREHEYQPPPVFLKALDVLDVHRWKPDEAWSNVFGS